ncbi:hypothetical protein BY996DRAFT_6423491 [Phakopsora pachyrhizi]|uniref:Expressed protein n=1 Tax=Phakopsora pachyrhizi TaxID=170000 RepID=A0AAV0BS19_PHAPC|nr:hypothetical protein BY996DRAFT_6423491 [Phakopsora pachyrhizi]CAH7688398.1 expressed protein [Phakopsora pachyrhizi]
MNYLRIDHTAKTPSPLRHELSYELFDTYRGSSGALGLSIARKISPTTLRRFTHVQVPSPSSIPFRDTLLLPSAYISPNTLPLRLGGNRESDPGMSAGRDSGISMMSKVFEETDKDSNSAQGISNDCDSSRTTPFSTLGSNSTRWSSIIIKDSNNFPQQVGSSPSAIPFRDTLLLPRASFMPSNFLKTNSFELEESWKVSSPEKNNKEEVVQKLENTNESTLSSSEIQSEVDEALRKLTGDEKCFEQVSDYKPSEAFKFGIVRSLRVSKTKKRNTLQNLPTNSSLESTLSSLDTSPLSIKKKRALSFSVFGSHDSNKDYHNKEPMTITQVITEFIDELEATNSSTKKIDNNQMDDSKAPRNEQNFKPETDFFEKCTDNHKPSSAAQEVYNLEKDKFNTNLATKSKKRLTLLFSTVRNFELKKKRKEKGIDENIETNSILIAKEPQLRRNVLRKKRQNVK